MSEELQIENENLKKQMQQNSVGISNMLAQCDAYKQLLNEANQTAVMIRTNLIIAQKQIDDYKSNLKKQDEIISNLKDEIEDLKKKLPM